MVEATRSGRLTVANILGSDALETPAAKPRYMQQGDKRDREQGGQALQGWKDTLSGVSMLAVVSAADAADYQLLSRRSRNHSTYQQQRSHHQGRYSAHH